MTRRGLASVATFSTFATAAVLANGAGHSLSGRAMALALERGAPPAAVAAAAGTPAATVAGPVATIEASTPPRPVAAAPAPAAAAPAPVYSAPASSAPTATATATPTATATSTPTATPTPVASKAKHVFVITLATADETTTYGAASTIPYLGELRPDGALLTAFAPVDGAELPNYIALAGGQKPNADTRTECATYSDPGCLYPNTDITVGDQVSSSGTFWRAYLEGMGDRSCVHPDTGAADATATATAGYVTRRNPFVYFHSLLDLGDCQSDDVDLTGLDKDLASIKTTAALSFITPALGTDPETFLRTWVPKIQDSPAYKKDGVLIIAGLANAAGTTDPTGALVLSRYAKAGSVYATPYTPYALLHSIESLLGLAPLEQAKHAPTFAQDVLRGAF